jgi:tetratricopeptide (TPR) repeat protein
VRFAAGTKPAEHVLVRLDRTDGGVAGEVTTDRAGKFRFTNLLPAQYVVTARAPGYFDAQQRIDLLTSNSEYVQLQLVADREAPAPATPAGTVSAAASVPAAAREEFEAGRALLLSGAKKENLDAGIKRLEKAVALHPDYPEAHLLLGTGYMDLKQLDRAERALRRALSVSPKSTAALFALGELHRQRREYDDAERVLREGLALDDKSAQGHFTLGRVYFERDDITRAGPEVGRALQLKPDFAEAHLVAGNILLRARRAEHALTEYQEYLRLAPEGPFAAQAREMVRKLKQALAEKK